MQLRLASACLLFLAQVNPPFRFMPQPPAGGGSPPVVNSSVNSAQTTITSAHTISLPPTVNAGELLIVFASFDGSPVTWDQTTHGTWTALDNSASRLNIWAKVAAGTEDSGTLSVTTDSDVTSAHIALSIGTWEGTLAGGTNASTVATGTDAAPNSSAGSDSWGTVPRKTFSAYGQDLSRSITAYPSGYDTDQYYKTGIGNTLGVAGRNATEGTQNPGAYTMSGTGAWRATSVSVRGTE